MKRKKREINWEDSILVYNNNFFLGAEKKGI